jgi:hypothetical protein
LHIIQLGDQRVNLIERTCDVSSGGISFLSPIAVEIGCPVEYVITLSAGNTPVRIRCLGKVLRSRQQAASNGSSLAVAVSMERYQFVRAEELEARRFPS